MKSRVLRMCKEIINTDVETLELEGINCEGIICLECPFWVENRVDGKECYEDGSMAKAHEIAKKYIENNEDNKKENDNMKGKKMKIIDIFNNWDNFKVDTEFYGEDIEGVVFSKNGYDDVVFKDDVDIFRLDYELTVKEPIKYVDFDDIEVGEEFMIEDRDGRILDNTYLKVEVFNEVKVLKKRCNGSVFVVNNIDLSKSNEFKFIRK